MVARVRKRRKPVSEINVVPYIDVMMVLLIVFMVTAPMLTEGVSVELPKTNAKPMDMPDQDEVLIVSVKADASYYLNVGKNPDKPIAVDKLADQVAKVLRAQPKRPVLIKGDAKVDYGVVVQLMARLQSAGVKDVGLITDPNELK